MGNEKHTIKLSVEGKTALGKMNKDVNSSLKKIENSVSSVQAKIATLVGAVGLGALVGASFRSADALAKNADKIGIATDKLAGLQHITEQYTNVGASAMNEALTKATKRLGEFNATGGGAASQWLKKLNLDTEALAKLGPDQIFYKYAESIRGLNDRGQQLAAISALMGDESRSLIGIIDTAPDKLQATTEEADRLGLALSRVETAKIEAANDAIDRAQKVLKGAGNTMAVEVAPYIEAIADSFVDAAIEGDGFKDVVSDGMETVSSAVGYASNVIRGLEFAWAGVKYGGASAVDFVVSSVANIDETITDFLNKIPGVTAQVNQDLATLASASRMMASDLKLELDKIAFSEDPSIKVSEYFNKIERQATIAAERVAKNIEIQSQVGASKSTPLLPIPVDDELSRSLERLQLQLMSEEQKITASYENRQFIVEESFQNFLISETTRNSMLESLHTEQQEKINSILRKGLSDREKFVLLSAKAQTKTVVGELVNMTAGIAQHSRAAFEVNKAASIANAAINAHEGASQSLAKYPWPLAGVMAGLHYAAGLSQVNAIRSASFSGGGGGAAPSASTTPATPVTPVGSSSQDAAESQAVSNQLVLYIKSDGNDKFAEAVKDSLEVLDDTDQISIIKV